MKTIAFEKKEEIAFWDFMPPGERFVLYINRTLLRRIERYLINRHREWSDYRFHLPYKRRNDSPRALRRYKKFLRRRASRWRNFCHVPGVRFLNEIYFYGFIEACRIWWANKLALRTKEPWGEVKGNFYKYD